MKIEDFPRKWKGISQLQYDNEMHRLLLRASTLIRTVNPERAQFHVIISKFQRRPPITPHIFLHTIQYDIQHTVPSICFEGNQNKTIISSHLLHRIRNFSVKAIPTCIHFMNTSSSSSSSPIFLCSDLDHRETTGTETETAMLRWHGRLRLQV